MDSKAEHQLLTDIELIKQKQEHTDTNLSKMLVEFVEHSKKTNETLSKLAVSSHELVIETRDVNKRVADLEKQVDTNDATTEDNFRSLGKRVAELESFKLKQETIIQSNKERAKWWSDNWHKILTVGVITIPVVVAVYKLMEM